MNINGNMPKEIKLYDDGKRFVMEFWFETSPGETGHAHIIGVEGLKPSVDLLADALRQQALRAMEQHRECE